MSANRTAVFGKRKEPHTFIIARGDDIRHFTVRPWVAAVAGSTLAAVAIGYLVATAYLVMRDDLVGASIARQARMQQAYEDRIAALRAQVDRITSRQLLDQQLMEEKVAELMHRQDSLADRSGKLGAVIERAGAAGLDRAAPAPTPRPDKSAALADVFSLAGLDSTTTGSTEPASAADRSDRLFVSINKSLRAIEAGQVQKLRTLTENAWETIDAIGTAVKTAGLKLDVGDGATGLGGPLLTDNPAASFEAEVDELDAALEKLDKARASARKVPLANPAPGVDLSSPFGTRTDPLLGTPAFHSGLDFRTPLGARIHATAGGVVSKAGWNGGYGQMVEIDHGNGLSTRYAHLSDIDVVDGQKVGKGEVIGKAGSTGRSTGPHLHYEVRRNGDAVDPITFLKAGKRIADAL